MLFQAVMARYELARERFCMHIPFVQLLLSPYFEGRKCVNDDTAVSVLEEMYLSL